MKCLTSAVQISQKDKRLDITNVFKSMSQKYKCLTSTSVSKVKVSQSHKSIKINMSQSVSQVKMSHKYECLKNPHFLQAQTSQKYNCLETYKGTNTISKVKMSQNQVKIPQF